MPVHSFEERWPDGVRQDLSGVGHRAHHGRVDRHGQTRKVRTWHHLLKTMEEYKFLSHIAQKVEEARSDLGSLSPILEESIEAVFISQSSAYNLNEAESKIDEVVANREKGPLEDRHMDYSPATKVLENARTAFGIDKDEQLRVLSQAFGLDGGKLDDCGEGDVFALRNPIPAKWKNSVDTLLDALTSAQRKITFNPSLFVKNENGMERWDERNDIALLSLGHPLMDRSVQSLRRYVWGSQSNAPITKWCLDSPPEACNLAFVHVLLIARNRRGEVVTERLSSLRCTADGRIAENGSKLPTNGGIEASPSPAWYRDIVASIQGSLATMKKAFEEEVKHTLEGRMARDRTEYLEWERRSLALLEETARASLGKELDKLDKEISVLEKETKQRHLDPFLDVKLRQQLEMKKKERLELGSRFNENKLREMKDHIHSEAKRFIEEIFPARYALGHVDALVAGIYFTRGD